MANTELDPKLKKQKTILYTTLQIAGLIAILLIGNCFDWLNMKFDFTNFTTWNYWNGVIQQILMYTIAMIIGYLGRLQKEFLTNSEFALEMNLYHMYLAQKTKTFVKFIEKIINPKIQIEYYHAHITKKLYRLEKKNSKKDDFKIEYEKCLKWCAENKKEIKEYTISDNIDGFLKKFKQRSCKRYIKKRWELEQLIDEIMIIKNAKTFSNYPRVNAHAFTWGVRSRDDNSNQYKVENTTVKDLSKRAVVKMLSVLLTSMLIGSIAADASMNELTEQAYGWIKLLIKYAIRVVTIFWSWGSGLFLGKGIFESNYLSVIDNRNRILAEYIDWKQENEELEETRSQKIRREILENAIKEESSIQIKKEDQVDDEFDDEEYEEIELTPEEAQKRKENGEIIVEK